jgi:hypothetical protein
MLRFFFRRRTDACRIPVDPPSATIGAGTQP